MAGTDVIFLECSDVQMLQSELNSRLAHKLHQRQDVVCKADYAALRKEFEVEREQHLKTQAQVAVLSEKLHLAEGEARMLSKQLEKEKETFDNAFGLLRSKALVNSTQADALLARCSALEALLERKQAELAAKDAQIVQLQQSKADMKREHKNKLDELSIRLQQEMYIAKLADRRGASRGK